MTRDKNTLLAPTREMRFWAKKLGPLLASPGGPRSVARELGTLLVTPLAHVTPFSFRFQTYLYGIFHRTGFARLAHTAMMPIIVTSSLALAFAAHPFLGMGLGLILAVYYAILGGLHQTYLLGALMVGIASAETALAWIWSIREGWSQPAAWMAVAVFVQTLSHGAEPDIPPRSNGTHQWESLSDFLWGKKRPAPASWRVARLGRAAFVFVGGLFNEWSSSWRLMPVDLNLYLWRLGYQSERRDEMEQLWAASLADRNPAIDAIGTGGAFEASDILAHPCGHDWSAASEVPS